MAKPHGSRLVDVRNLGINGRIISSRGPKVDTVARCLAVFWKSRIFKILKLGLQKQRQPLRIGDVLHNFSY